MSFGFVEWTNLFIGGLSDRCEGDIESTLSVRDINLGSVMGRLAVRKDGALGDST